MATTIERYLANASKAGIDTKSREAIDWYKGVVRKSATSPNRIMAEEKASLINSWTNTGPGQMYLVHYDPKHKKTLPFYDTFPLIIPIERYNDGILGLNLHYLSPMHRARLLDSLLDTANNQRYDESTKMKLSYKIVQGVAESKYYNHCVKRYLGKHFRSRFVKISTEAWPIAAMLPVEQFEKASKKEVWNKMGKN